MMLFLYLRNNGNNKDLLLLKRIMKTKQASVIKILFAGTIILTFLWALFHGTNDFGLVKSNLLTFISIFSTLCAVPLIVNHLFDRGDYLHEITKILLYVFIIQSIIQLIAFVYPPFSAIINIFKKDIINNRDFQGIRSLALTGNPFFTLSSAYGLMFINYFYLFSNKKIKYPVIIFILLLVGSFFAGRTAFVGLIIGVVSYFTYSIGSFKKMFFSVISISFYILITSIITYIVYLFLIPQSILVIVDEKLLPFALEFYYKFQETGKLTTKSTDVLSKMYFEISMDTLLFGDGKYFNNDGSYYMYTDAGYMRNILFYGVLGFFYIVFAQVLILKKTLRSKIDFSSKLFLLFTLFYFFILHYKGEVLMSMPILQSILVLYSLNYLFIKDK
ncbi:hypothetical protein CW731_07945 [Polaribacter sp. ALD11]|nr:hypothetical protein CW731_07945 [Polaribacter sp. ALD11]